jgi:autotransporter-associated beta strand protein
MDHPTTRRWPLAWALLAAGACLALPLAAPAMDMHFDYTSFDNPNTPGADPHFGQSQFNVLNYPSINGNFMLTSTDTHRPEMVANGNDLSEFYNNFLADYNTQFRSNSVDATAEATAINQYTLQHSTTNGPRPQWLVLNEISAILWQQSPGAPSASTYRQWVVDCVTKLHDTYGYTVVTYAPFATVGTGNAASWQAVAAKSYIGIENYLSGPEVMAGGTDYASRVAWAQSQYQASVNSYQSVGVSKTLLFTSEHFGQTTADKTFGRAGISAADWDSVIQIRQDAIYNVGFAGFLGYSWGSNSMGISEAEQIEHEYYYRSRLVLPSQKPQWLSDSAINVNGTNIPLSWNQPLNWLGGVPNSTGAEANFWRTNTANRTITLDGSKTVGKLTFDSSFSYTIGAGTGGSIVFNDSSSIADLVSDQGSHTISTAVQFASNVLADIDAGQLTIGGAVSGSGGLTKSGSGTLVLSALNSYAGDTNVQDGTLRLGRASLADSSNLYLKAGTTLDLNFTGSADTVRALYFNGVAQSIGVWGAVGSGAQFTSPLLTGTGRLNITTSPPVLPPPPGHVIDDFETNEGHFGWAYNYSPAPDTYGLAATTTIDRVTTEHQGSGNASQLLNLVTSGSGAWQLRHNSGIGANQAGQPSGNSPFEANGYVGFWLKTDDAGITVRIGIDDPVGGNAALERGYAQSVIADNQWHLYQWNLDNATHWDAYSGGANGVIDAPTGFVTIDSIWFGGTGNAQIFLDNVSNNPLGLLAAAAIPGDYNGDGTVNTADYTMWRSLLGNSVTPGTKADGNGDGVIDAGDYTLWRKQMLLFGGTSLGGAAIPEPTGATLLVVAFGLIFSSSLRPRIAG